MHDVAPVHDIIFADGLGVVSFGAAPAQAKPRSQQYERRAEEHDKENESGSIRRRNHSGRADGARHRASCRVNFQASF